MDEPVPATETPAARRMRLKRRRDKEQGKVSLLVSYEFANLYRRFSSEGDLIEHLKQDALRKELEAKEAQQSRAAELMQELIDLLEASDRKKSK